MYDFVQLLYRTRKLFIYNCSTICVLFFLGCSSGTLLEKPSDFDSQISRLKSQLAENKNDASVIRELGVLYFKAEQYQASQKLLTRANQLEANHPETLFFLGMNAEFDNDVENALRYYQNYPEVSRLSDYRDLMEGRFRWLTAEKIRQEMNALLANEGSLSLQSVSPEIIAVFPLVYQGSNERYKPLGRGLSEMLTIDLSQINDLRIVERVRLQALLDELSLSHSESVNAASAPRIGKLLKAGRLVHGHYSDLGGEQLRVDLAAWNVVENNFPKGNSEVDEINNLFRIQKALAFQIIASLGIELTEEERRNIEYIPTQNLRAFLAYSIGLELEDEGRYREAQQQFEAAAALDPGFTNAQNKAQINKSLQAAGFNRNQMAKKLSTRPRRLQQQVRSELARRRLQKTADRLGSSFLPGREKRKGAEEADPLGRRLGVEGFADPPPPPPVDLDKK